jgi:hypothetical protein
LAFYVTPLLLAVIWILGLYVLSDRRRERAEQLFGFAAEQLGDSLFKLGENKLERDPAAAVRLALSARNLTDSLAAPELLDSAVKKHPVWATVRPSGPIQACRSELIVPDLEAHAAVVDMEASAVVVSAETAGTQLLELRAVPSGALLASRQMEIAERVVRAGRIAADYFLTRIAQSDGAATFRVYGTSAAQFNDPVIEVTDLKDAQLTAGGFPLFALNQAGQVVENIERR